MAVQLPQAAPQPLIQLVSPEQCGAILANPEIPQFAKNRAIGACFAWFKAQRERDLEDFNRIKTNYENEIRLLRDSVTQWRTLAEQNRTDLGTAQTNITTLEGQVRDKQTQIDNLRTQNDLNQQARDREIARLNKIFEDQAAAQERDRVAQIEQAKKLKAERYESLLETLYKQRDNYVIKDLDGLPPPDWYYKLGLHLFRDMLDAACYKEGRVYFDKVIASFKANYAGGKDPDEALHLAKAAHRR